MSFSDVNRLNESTILAVWCLIPKQVENSKIESQMIGLAKDNNGKLFHWTTDFQQDIFVLMQYSNTSDF